MSASSRHEKVRFTRTDFTPFDQFPSARLHAPAPRERKKRDLRAARLAGRVLIAGFAACLAIIILTAAISQTRFGSEWIREQASAAIDRMMGDDLVASLGSASLSFDPMRGMLLRAGDVALAAAGEAGGQVLRVGELSFDISLSALLQGRIGVAGVRVSDAAIELPALAPDTPLRAGGIFDERGLIVPDALISAVFNAGHVLAEQMETRATDLIRAEHVELALGTGPDAERVLLRRADLRHGRGEALTLDAALDWQGRDIDLSARLTRDAAGLIDEFELLAVAGEQEPAVADLAAADMPQRHPLGAFRIELSGVEDAPGEGRLDLAARIERVTPPIRNAEPLDTAFDVTASLESGEGVLELGSLSARAGGSHLSFSGAVRPADPARAAHYRLELASDGNVLAPADTNEDPMEFVAELVGAIAPDGRRIGLDDIEVRTAGGGITGSADFEIADRGSPGIRLDLAIDAMPVAQVKQAWPWFAVRGARRWVMDNISGGTVAQGSLRLDLPPARIGNGVPLTGAEVSGRFDVEGTRFNMAGDLPPARRATGSVEFGGTDVDVTLDSGTVVLASGRGVEVSNGTLTIREGYRRPVLGRLSVELAGAAPDILEFASYEPIDVGRHIDFRPDEFEGEVTGTVVADIPLHAGIEAASLDWTVDLSYRDLSIARPFHGQTVTDATGTILLRPEAALIIAQARLNGIPATLDLVEPFGPGAGDPARNIRLALDDRGRAALAPGLDMVLGGLANVSLEDRGQGSQHILADLDSSILSVPWIGWSKGVGVPAQAQFNFLRDGDTTRLTDFRLTGDSFALSGDVLLGRGGVERVRFPAARLNRDDDFSVDLSREGEGYAVTVRGQRLDARSAIKNFTQGVEGAARAVEGVPVRLDLEIATVSGFHGESMRDVVLSYRGRGSAIDEVEFEGTTDTGRRVRFTETRQDGQRVVAMQSGDAGAVLRFLDIYERVEGGSIILQLQARDNGPLRGHVDARDFLIVNEPRLSSIATTTSSTDGRSLNQAVRGEFDSSRVQFEQAFSRIEKGAGYLALNEGVVRGPAVGATYQGTLYDAAGQMAMTGTFMPAYGLNRIFGELPLVGQILGNGRDRGLIGITFRLHGRAGEPQLEVNPLSVIAPGIFRSVFEYR